VGVIFAWWLGIINIRGCRVDNIPDHNFRYLVNFIYMEKGE